MGSRALSHRIYLGSVLVFAWLYMAAGSQCTPAVLMAACHGLNVASEWFIAKSTHVHALDIKPSLYYR